MYINTKPKSDKKGLNKMKITHCGLNLKNIKKGLVDCEYAVRGRVLDEALKIEDNIKDGKYSFEKIVYANIGNMQSLGVNPITYPRQVLSAVQFPEGSAGFPSDVRKAASELRASMPGHSAGSYTHSMGLQCVREKIAKFIEARDGIPSDFRKIFITGGATPGIKIILELLISHNNVGIMTPVPGYPLYKASITSYNGKSVPYYLNEELGWSFETSDLEDTISKSSAEVRALCIINPNNPTGGVTSEKTLREAVKFAEKHNLVILADEVYQENIIGDTPFASVKKVVHDLKANVQLFSFNSISKGFYGECGQRGGYFECVNVSDDLIALILKLSSMNLCPPTSGQVILYSLVNPPKKGDESYDVYMSEINANRDTISNAARVFMEIISKCPYITCSPPGGALYLYPSILLPNKFIKEALKHNVHPDEYFCMLLLKKEGVCTTPGSGFDEKEGTYHLRITLLGSGMDKVTNSLVKVINSLHS